MSTKWAVITGASSGIGADIARNLAKKGYNLVLVARTEAKLAAIAKELSSPSCQIKTLSLDLTRIEAPEQLLRQTDEWGLITEVLVNNAGIGAHGSFLDQTLESAFDMINLNMSALVRLSHLYGARMRGQGHGYILQVASTAAFQAIPNYAIYGASKSFVLSFSRALNFELRGTGVSSTALCPGPTATNFFSNAKHSISKQIAKLMMKPSDVAEQGVEAMFDREETRVAGLANQLGAFLPRLLPSNLVVRAAWLITK